MKKEEISVKFTVWFFLVVLGFAMLINPQLTSAQASDTYKHSIDICPLSPMFDIYVVQYYYRQGKADEFMAGLAYANIKYDSGRTHSPTLVLGYKRYIWKKFHVEDQIWPAYDAFYSSSQKRYYKGFDMWNEFRIGYTLDFKIAHKPCYINLQGLMGFGLVGGFKPQDFKDEVKEDPVFFSPIFFIGMRF
jgi:hypothetical protein